MNIGESWLGFGTCGGTRNLRRGGGESVSEPGPLRVSRVCYCLSTTLQDRSGGFEIEGLMEIPSSIEKTETNASTEQSAIAIELPVGYTTV